MRLIQRFGKDPYFRVHLDEIGSFIWERCDGNKRILEIGECLHHNFGERVEPVYERLGTFVRILAYQKYIIYKGNQDPFQ